MSGKRVIVSTIHSFLYNYIVKPYISFIAKDEGFAVDLLKGDDDRLLIDYPTIELIKQKTNQQWVSNDVIIKCIPVNSTFLTYICNRYPVNILTL